MIKINDNYNIALIDDDNNALEKLYNICSDFFKAHQIDVQIELFSNSMSFPTNKISYDLLFIDIEMPEVNGIELAKIIRSKYSQVFICFVTSFSNYAIEAHSVHAFDYILKPITTERIYSFLTEFLKYSNKSPFDSIIFPLNTTIGNINVPIDRIIYFEYIDRSDSFLNRSVKVLLTNNKEYIIKTKISSIMEKLPHGYFYMPHKSFIVNLMNVEKILSKEILLKLNILVPISQKKNKDFKKAYGSFIKDFYL